MNPSNAIGPQNQKPEPALSPAVPGGAGAAGDAAPPRNHSRAERVLLAPAAGLGVLFAWLMTARVPIGNGRLLLAVFWLCLFAVYSVLHRVKVRARPVLWPVAGCIAALCVWNLLHDSRSSYGQVTSYVIPAVLVAWAALVRSGLPLKEVATIVCEWAREVVLFPFSALGQFFGVSGDVLGKQDKTKKTLLALGIACPLLVVIVPLLMSADAVFGHYLGVWLRSFNLGLLVFRLLVAFVAAALLYSFLWNSRYGGALGAVRLPVFALDGFVGALVLGLVLAVYALFCAVQFTYLFAGAGLPEGLTYSEYAREGFWQLIVVAGINLLLFSVVLQYGKLRRFTVMLAVLLAETGVLLVSAIVRLRLYIGALKLTWLRLLSAWFIVYLAVVLVLCAVRMARPKLPLVAVCALLLVGWYTALGFANPDRLIVQYNLAAAEDRVAWVEENRAFLRALSDDAVVALVEELPDESLGFLVEGHGLLHTSRGRSLASREALARLLELEEEPARGVAP